VTPDLPAHVGGGVIGAPRPRGDEPPGAVGTAHADDDHGPPDAVVGEIRARDQRQLELFLRLTAGATGILWLGLTVFVYAHAFSRSPALGLLFAPILAVLGAAIGALPIAIVCGVGVLVLCPRHPKAAELERYEAAHPRTRPCDVCVLVRDDHRPRPGVSYCARCDAWMCPDCRSRYDLRAIAALRAARARGESTHPGPGAPSAPAR